MTGYGGYFLKGLGEGMQSGLNMVQQIEEMKWKREEKAKLKKEQDDLVLAVGKIQGKATAFAEGGWTSQEVSDFSAMVHAGSIELQSRFKGQLESIEKGDRERVESYKTLINEWTKDISDMDLSNMDTAYENFSSQITDPEAKKYLDINYKMKQSTAKQKEEQMEYFPNFEKMQAKYGKGATGTLVQGKGIVYTGQRDIQPKSSDYINLMNVLGAVAEGKTDEEFQAFKTKMEAETGINLGDISRSTFIDLPDPEEIKRMNLNDVLFGTRGIMNEYIESGKDLDDEMMTEIRSKWILFRPLMSAADQQRGDAYFASIGIDLNPPKIEIDIGIGDVSQEKGFWGSRVEDIKVGAKGLSDWIDKWIEPEQFPKKY